MSTRRLLDPALLPASLWNPASQTLLLPPALAQAYETVIDRHDLRVLSESRDRNNSPIGGPNKTSADQHFAQAFDGSAARAQLAATDPKDEVCRASNALIQALSGSRVCITDAPCGSGAAVFAFLSVIAELRVCRVLPRQPLDVYLTGADISGQAMGYAAEILNELRSFFESQAIFVKDEFLSWDVTDKLSNTDLIHRMTLASNEIKKHFLIIANFSGFLKTENKKKTVQPQLDELFRYASCANSVAIWIEPKTNDATGGTGLFSIIIKWVTDPFRRFIRINTDGDRTKQFLSSECHYQLPLSPEKTSTARLAVMRLDLARSS